MYKLHHIAYKKVRVRNWWRRIDDYKNSEKDQKVFEVLKSEIVRAT